MFIVRLQRSEPPCAHEDRDHGSTEDQADVVPDGEPKRIVIELVSTDAPFSPPDAQIPVELGLGTQTAPVLVYDDPNSEASVNGVMTTIVDDPNYSQNGYNLHLRRITVTISYQFRNRAYNVTMHTIRASDA